MGARVKDKGETWRRPMVSERGKATSRRRERNTRGWVILCLRQDVSSDAVVVNYEHEYMQH